MIRPGIVNSIVLTLASNAPVPQRMREVAALGATDEEKRAAGDLLAKSAIDTLVAAGALVPTQSLSSALMNLTWYEARETARRIFLVANAVGWLTDRLTYQWFDPAGHRTLADVLKVLPPELLEYLRRELAIAGIPPDDQDGDGDDDQDNPASAP